MSRVMSSLAYPQVRTFLGAIRISCFDLKFTIQRRQLPQSGGRSLRRHGFHFRRFEVGEESGEDADDGEKRTDAIDEIDVGEVGELAEEGCADAAHAEGQAKK